MTDPASLEVVRAIEEIIRDVRMKEGQRRTLRKLVSEVERQTKRANDLHTILTNEANDSEQAITALRSRLARAEELLRPFAELAADRFELPDEWVISARVKDLRAAAVFLTPPDHKT